MIKIHRSTDSQWYFTIVAKNGKVIVTSETYTSKRNCLHAVNVLEGIFLNQNSVNIIDTTL